MTPRLLIAALLACGLSVAQDKPTPKPAPSPGDKPDVLFIAVDDLNDWVGVLGGHPQAKTPNIDRLAERGMLFTNAHTAAPSCNPSRTALLFGMRPSTTGVYGNIEFWRDSRALKGKLSLPQLFRANGYRTATSGKIFHAHTYYEQGFYGQPQPEAWDDAFPSHERQLPPELRPRGWPVNGDPGFVYNLFDWAGLDVEDNRIGDGQVVEWAERKLKEPHEKPLFLAVGIFRPHLPWYVPARYFEQHPLDQVELPATIPNDLDDLPPIALRDESPEIQPWLEQTGQWKSAVQAYLASVTFADAMVGRLLAALDQSGRADKTIVVLWSDHGFHLGEKRRWRKFTLWEVSTHVPLIFVAPGVTKAGSKTKRPVSLLDVYPTLAELAGLPAPEYLEGDSLTPLIKNPDAAWDHPAVTTWLYGNHAVRSEDWRYIRYVDGSEELYDHREDPHEWRNLAAKPEMAERKRGLAAWLPKLNVPPAGQ